jgi:hypothetical protein
MGGAHPGIGCGAKIGAAGDESSSPGPLTAMDISPIARPIRAGLLAVAGMVLLSPAAPAAAGEFTISACQADRVNRSTQAFDGDFATRGMMWKRACDPVGEGLRGLVTANVQRPGRVPRGSRSYFVMTSPPGTRFTRFSWSGQLRRRDCRYALQIWASRPDGPPIPIKNLRANKRCPQPSNFQVAGQTPPRTYNVPGATRIVQRIVCVGAAKAPHCSSRGRNYIRTWQVYATVQDLTAPAVGVMQDNPFTQGQWVAGPQTVNYVASDNVGIRRARAIATGISRGEQQRVCNAAARIPCPNGRGSMTVDTGRMPEGSQPVTVVAVDAAENSAASSPVTVRVDNTAPGAVAADLVGGSGWRNQNNFDAGWINPPESDRAPIVAAHYRICPASGGACREVVRAGADISALTDLAVPGPGEWLLRVWRRDAAGNQEPANASLPVSLKFDPEPPQLAFEQPSSSDPTQVSVAATDRISGLARGQIELSRLGSGVWQSLPTDQHGGRLLARIDDSALPAGVYLLRATAWDQASNQNSTDRRADGTPMAVTLPLRVPTVLRVGVQKARTVRRSITLHGNRRIVRRRVVELRPQAKIGYGQPVVIAGRLENRDGQPVPGAEIQVLSGSATDQGQLVGTVSTDSAGRFLYEAQADATRTLRFVYGGTLAMLPARDEVSVFVSAASSFRANPRRLRNGQSVRFTGRLRALPAPPAGKLVELQVVLSGRWQTFRTTRTAPNGSWAVRYRFRRTCGLLRYRFRARLPAEAGYAFQTGYTRDLAVRVRGEACR